MTHSPTSLSMGFIPPPTNLVASTPLKRMVWTTDADAGCMLSVPSTMMFLVEVSVAELFGSKLSRAPAATATPAAWAAPPMVTVVPPAIVAGSSAWGTCPPLQVEESDQAPDLTLWTGVTAPVDGTTSSSPPPASANATASVTTVTTFVRELLAAC